MAPVTDHPRPLRREDCREAPRPCPYVGCRHHLFLDVHPKSGRIQLNFPGFGVQDLTETCALDVAERDEASAEEIGDYLNLTAERIRQIEVSALHKLSRAPLGEDD